MAAVSKNVYFAELNNIVDKYNNTYHNTIKMKPIEVKVALVVNLKLAFTG